MEAVKLKVADSAFFALDRGVLSGAKREVIVVIGLRSDVVAVVFVPAIQEVGRLLAVAHAVGATRLVGIPLLYSLRFGNANG